MAIAGSTIPDFPDFSDFWIAFLLASVISLCMWAAIIKLI